MHLHHSIYLSPNNNLNFFQYLLVPYPVLSDQSPNSKHLLSFSFRINIPHPCFIQFVLFVFGGPLPKNRNQGK